MQRIAFGATGALVAPLGIGAIAVESDPSAAARVVEQALDNGCNLVDTAACYPGHEQFLGQWLAHRREDFLLVSKCGHHAIGNDGVARSRPITMDDIDAALERLRTDHLDAMLLHSYDVEPLQRGEALGVLERARAQGKLRWVGYSGDGAAAAWAAGHEAVQVIECSINLADQRNIVQVLPRCRERGVAVIAKKPIANAAWRCIGAPDGAHPAWRAYVERFAALDLAPEDHGCGDMAELALRFTLSVPGVHCAIVGSADPAHRAANHAAVARGPLSTTMRERIRRRFDTLGADWPPCN
ncbi:MAG: aldo/keto reductase [Planctomycetota bacterium]